MTKASKTIGVTKANKQPISFETPKGSDLPVRFPLASKGKSLTWVCGGLVHSLAFIAKNPNRLASGKSFLLGSRGFSRPV